MSMKQLLLALVFCLATACSTFAQQNGRDRVFKVDPVELIDHGKEVLGKVELSLQHERYLYLFSTPANLAAFKADSAKYRVQFGGACARMGPLSGEGSAKLFAVHESRLYFFASEQCRRAFLAGPEQFLDRDDPPIVASPDDAARAGALVDRAVNAVGGASKLDTLATYREQLARTVESGGKAYAVKDTVTLLLPGGIRTDTCWNDSCWANVVRGAEGWSLASGRDDGPLAEDQMQAVWRDAGRHVLALLRNRTQPGLVVAADGTTRTLSFDGDGDVVLELLKLHAKGTTTTLGVDVKGRVRLLAFNGRGPSLTLGEIEQRFTGFHDVGGLVLPSRVDTFFGGKPVADKSGSFAVQTVNDPADRALFERVTPTPTPTSTPASQPQS